MEQVVLRYFCISQFLSWMTQDLSKSIQFLKKNMRKAIIQAKEDLSNGGVSFDYSNNVLVQPECDNPG